MTVCATLPGKIMSGLRALGERVSRSPGNSAHGGTSFHAARNFDWLARLGASGVPGWAARGGLAL